MKRSSYPLVVIKRHRLKRESLTDQVKAVHEQKVKAQIELDRLSVLKRKSLSRIEQADRYMNRFQIKK
jgi:hypothetical protein